MKSALRAAGVRVNLDLREESMGYKIRQSQTQKVPYQLVVGDRERDDNAVNVRRYGEEKQETVALDEFVKRIVHEIETFSRHDEDEE